MKHICIILKLVIIFLIAGCGKYDGAALNGNTLTSMSRCYGGKGQDFGNAIAAADDGCFFITGMTNSTDGNVKNNHGNSELWVFKIDPSKERDEQLVYSRCFGGSNDDFGSSIILSKNGCIIVVGTTNSTDGDLSGIRKGNSKDQDIWLLKIDPSKSENEQILFSRCFGGTGDDDVASITEDNDGSILIAGHTKSLDGDPIGCHKGNDQYGQTNDLWVLKINPSLPQDKQIVYNRCFGGSSEDEGASIALTKDGCFMVAGHTFSTNGDINNRHKSKNPDTQTCDFWVLKINPLLPKNKQIVYNKCFGGSGNDILQSMILQDDYVVAAGITLSSDGDVKNYHEGKNNYGEPSCDVWVIKIDPSLPQDKQIVYDKCFGGSNDDVVHSMALAEDKCVLITGKTNSTDGDMSNIRIGDSDDSDLLVMKIDPTIGKHGPKFTYIKCFGGRDNDAGMSIIEAEHKRMLITGYTQSWDGGLMFLKNIFSKTDCWILKISIH